MIQKYSLFLFFLALGTTPLIFPGLTPSCQEFTTPDVGPALSPEEEEEEEEAARPYNEATLTKREFSDFTHPALKQTLPLECRDISFYRSSFAQESVDRDFIRCKLNCCNLIGSILDSSSFRKCRARGCVFNRANLTDFKATSCDFSFSYFRRLQACLEAHFIRCVFRRCCFISADLAQSKFFKCNFEKAKFEKADLERTRFQECAMQDTDFTSLACALHTSFFLCHLERANFTNAKLKRANFSRAFLQRANFTGANLYKANLCGADLEGIIIDELTSFLEAKIDSNTRLSPHLFDIVMARGARFIQSH